MIRNLKTLALALIAVFTMSAVAASAASAVGMLTSDGPVTQDATEIGGAGKNGLAAFGSTIECPGSTYLGHKYNVTPHQLIEVPATTATITPNYASCSDGTHKITVTLNGCDFVFHSGETVGEDEYAQTIDLVCPPGKMLELHTYLSANNSNTLICTFKDKPQTGLTGPTIRSDTANEDLVIEGAVTGFHVEKEGLCGSGTTNAAEIYLDITIKGTSEIGKTTGIKITDS